MKNFKAFSTNLIKKKGVTLVELLIVVGIITIISLAIIPSYVDFAEKKDFNNKVEIMVTEILNIRNKALAGAVVEVGGVPQEVDWGIQPKQDCLLRVYFLGYVNSSGTFVPQVTQDLPEGVTFGLPNGTCEDIIFERLKGTPVLTGSDTERQIILNYKSQTRTITVNSSGRISYN